MGLNEDLRTFAEHHKPSVLLALSTGDSLPIFVLSTGRTDLFPHKYQHESWHGKEKTSSVHKCGMIDFKLYT